MPGNIDQLLLVYDDIQDADDAAAVNKDEMDSNLSLTRSKSNQSLSVHQYLHHPSHQMEHKHTILRSVSQTDLIAPALRTNTPPVNVQATANGTVFNGTRSNPSSGSSSSALPTPTGRKHAGSNMSSGGYNRGSVPGPTVLTSGQKDKRYHFGSYQKQHSQTSINLRKPVVTTEHPPHPARPASPNLRQRGGMSPSPSTSRLSQFEAMEGELEDLDLGDTAHRSDVPATITIAPHHTPPSRPVDGISTIVTPPRSPPRKKSSTHSPLNTPDHRTSDSSTKTRGSIQSTHNNTPAAEITKEVSRRMIRLLSPCDAVKPSYGFAIQRHGQHIYIICAQKGTPASEAKLRVGDELIAVNKRDISQFTIGQVMGMVRKDYACTLTLANQPIVRFFKLDRKGHSMGLTINKCQITHLVSGGLADRAGIPKGYYIICINGKSALGVSDQKLCLAMREHDTVEFELIAAEAYRDFFNKVVIEKLADLNYY